MLESVAVGPDGDTITYLWSQTQGPTVTLSSSTSASTTFDAPLINSTQAILTFSLTVNDGAVDSTPDTVDITVSNVNTPPTAHAGGDQTVNEGTTDIQLNGSATDPDTDDTITYLWSQTQGPTVTLSSSTSASTTFDAPLINSTQAILTFSLTVNDGAVDSTPDTVDITVSNVNTPPTAHAGGDQTVNEGTTDIQLNGTGSADPDGDTITYLWSQTQGPTVTLSSSTSASTTFDAPLINSTQAILTFSLTVNDGAVDSTPDTVDITVSNVNTPPTAHAGGDQTVNEGTTDIQLNGSATDPDTDDTITYLWSQTQGPTVTLSSSTSASTTFDAPLINSTQAILTFSLTVNDGAVDSTPDTVDITVSNVNTPPTAHAGGDQTVNEGTTDIQLNGTGSADPDGDTITYLWSQTQGPTVTLSSSTSASTTFDAPLINSTQAILTFSLTVNDGAVDSTPDTVDITVSNVNTPPTAHAGGDQTVNEGTTDIQLNGTGSADPDGDTITYLWSQTQGPTVTLSSSTSASTTFDAPLINSTQAILTFSLTVNDGAVDSTPDTVDITVSNVNTPPTAHAGGDQTVNEGTTDIQLNGTGSADPDGDTITYLWSQTQGPTVTLSSSTSASTTFDAPLINSTQAILTFSLTVNDGAVDSTPDTVDITVSNVNTPPTAHAGGDQTVNEGTTDIQLNGSATDPDTDDTITYLWSQTQGPTVTLSSSTSASTTFDAPLINSTQAILTFSLTVNDGAVDSTPDTVDITVSNVNTPPTAHAGGDQTVNEGTTDIQLNGSATDPDTDDTITYLWSQTQGPTVTLSSSTSASTTFDAPLINSTQAILTFSLTVNDGAVDSTPDTVDITVSNVNTPPTAHAGGDQTVNEGTTDIQLNGSATDPDTDDTITYLWSQTQGPTVTLSSSTSASTTFDAPLINSTQAILTFSLTVNDGAVDSTPDTVDITVSNVNTPPTAHAGGDQTVNEGTTDIQLNGSATDPDTDDTITYLWSQTQGPTVTLSSSTSASTTFDAPLINSTQAILTFSLTVNDGAVDSTPDTVDITVSNVNTPPTAHAGGDQTVNEGTTDIQLNGSATDPDTDDTITYLWSQTQGPTVTLSSSTSASTTFDAPLINSTQAILTFSLTVNDGAVDSTPDTVDITVSNVNTPPTAHAGGDQTVNEGTTDIQLNGSATDPDTDDTITYLWSQTQGPTVTLSSSTSASTTFDAPLINSTQAILTFSLTVNDGAVDSTPDTVDITVSNVNTPPTAHAGGDQTVNEGTTDIQLNGSATDPDTDDTITYLWSQTQGPTVTLSSSTSASTTFDAPLINSTQAILTFSLTVNDGAVDSTPDTVDITVSNVNTPPTAHAGGDQTVNEGTTDIQLNGSATDPDTDDTITYLWSQTQGPTVTLSSSTSASTTFDAPLINSTQAILTFSLTVNDGAVDSTPDTVDITVSNVNTPPTAHAGGDQTVNEGTTDIQLNGSATDPDTDDTITYLWSQTQGPTVTLSSSTSASTTFDAPLINSTQAILTFSLTVNDGAVDSTPDTVDITVSNVNTPPTAHAGGDQTVNEGTTDIQLNGSATDPDTDDTITYLWSQTQGPTVTLSSSTSASTTFDAPLINSTQAILTFSLTVNDGAVDSTPDTVDITVSNVNTPPTAHAGGDQTVNEGTTDIQLNGSATDPDTDDTITYLWSQTQGPTVTLSSSTSASTTFDAPLINSTQAILTFSLTVNDGAVDSTPDTVDITVSNVNTPPTAHAGGDQTVNEGTTDIQLNGSATDPDTDDTITYLWSQTQGPTVTLSSSTSASTTFDAPLINSTQAILTFSLTVNDGAVDSTPDTVDITVSNVNTPPTAHAGGDQTVNEGTTDIQLNGSATDPDTDDTITYLWSQTQGPTVTLSSSTSASTTFDAPLINSTQAILTFSLTVNDGAVDSTPDTVDITVSNVNTPPTAHAGGDQTVNEGTTDIQLNGSATDPDTDDTITYLWSQTQGPTVTLSSSTSASTTFDAPLINSTQAILTFSLTVNDGAVDSTPDTVDITVSNVNTPPTAHAGGDQTVNEGTTDIQLNGSATDPDTDDTITYLWSQTQGPTVTLSSSTSASTTFDAPLINSTQAILTFSLTVNDGAVDSTPDTVDITVSNVNTPPTAHAGGDQTVNEGTTDIQLNGSATDPDTDDTITYLWSQTQGPTVTLSSSTSASTTFDAPLINSTQAILTFSLTVNDGAVDSTPDTVDITVSNVNTPPTAHAGGDQTVNEGTTDIQLNGSATDPDTDDTITYLWSQTQGPTVTLSSSTSASTTFDAPLINSTQAILTFSLTVNDGAVDSTPDTVDITVSNVNTPPTAHAGGDQTVNEGTTDIQLNGSATDPDTDDTITYLWSQTQGPTVTLSSSTSASTTFDAPLINSTQAILTFSLTVNDGAVDSTPDTVDITVSNVNTPPTAHAGGDQTVNEGTTDIQLNGSATDPDTDDTITYLWSQTQGPTVTLSSSTSASTTFDAPLINSTQAILTFSLTVNDGAVDSTPDTVDITVSNVNTPPTAHAGGDQTVNEGTTDIQLNGSATDPDTDDTITYLWSQTQGPTVTLFSSTSESPRFTTPTVTSEQTLIFSLVVNDGTVDSTPDTVDITIQDTINESPTAHAGDDQTVSEGTTDIQLNGTGSADPNGDAITYAWSQNEDNAFEVTLSSSTSESPRFTTPTVTSDQTLTFSLTVNDGAVDSTPDTVDITVLDTDDVLLTSPGSPSGSSGSSSSGSSSGIGTSGGGGGGGSGSSSGIGISGGGGGSGSSSGIGISGGGGGRGSSTWVDDIYLKSVSWDCNAGTIKIIVGPDSDYISVAVRTTQLGIHQASIAGDDIPGYRAFVSPMHKTEDYINIKAVALSGRNLVAISESIDVDACVGERTYHTPDDSTTTTIKQPVPKQEDDKDRLADFVDPKKNPQYYIDRYNNEIEYREWFDENYPGITIYEAVGLPVPDPTLEPAVEQEPAVDPEPAMKQEPEPICDPRAELVDGFCIPVTPRPEENGGGCLIATAAYGTELAPQVQLLREIRDNTVLQTQSGSAFMDSFNSFYYSFSPSIADLERQNPVFREAVKMAVTPLISSLAILDYVDIDSESEMLGYGIGIVAMNIAMYVALPVSALYYVRRLVA